MTDELDLRLVRPSTFEPLLGSEFVCHEPAARFRLTDVTAFGTDHNAPRHEPFTLTFVGDSGLPQQTYELEHESLGRLEIFLVPIGGAPDGLAVYEAVFN